MWPLYPTSSGNIGLKPASFSENWLTLMEHLTNVLAGRGCQHVKGPVKSTRCLAIFCHGPAQASDWGQSHCHPPGSRL